MVQWLGLSAFTTMAQMQSLVGRTNILQGVWQGQKIKKKKEEERKKEHVTKRKLLIRPNRDIFDYNFTSS